MAGNRRVLSSPPIRSTKPPSRDRAASSPPERSVSLCFSLPLSLCVCVYESRQQEFWHDKLKSILSSNWSLTKWQISYGGTGRYRRGYFEIHNTVTSLANQLITAVWVPGLPRKLHRKKKEFTICRWLGTPIKKSIHSPWISYTSGPRQLLPIEIHVSEGIRMPRKPTDLQQTIGSLTLWSMRDKTGNVRLSYGSAKRSASQ